MYDASKLHATTFSSATNYLTCVDVARPLSVVSKVERTGREG